MYIIGMTGASGAILGIRLIEELLCAGEPVSAIASVNAYKIIAHEIFSGDPVSSIKGVLERRGFSGNTGALAEYSNDDLFAPPASGTFIFKAVVVIPCSMKTLSAAASGYADCLINRAVDVALKEDRRCVLLPRETPLSLIHIENMMRVKRAGADIVLPVPAFYNNPETIEDVIDFVVARVLNLLGVKHNLIEGWGGDRRDKK